MKNVTQINGQTAGYETCGQGDPALLLHGWGCESALMRPVAQQLCDVRTCYLPDFPGFGETPEPAAPWSVTEYMAWLVALMDALGIQKADIIAHSFGARVALLLAKEHPQRVGKMVITGGAGLIPRRTVRYYWRVWLYKLGKRLRALSWLNALLKRLGLDLDQKAAAAGSDDYRALSANMKKTFVRVVNQDLRGCLAQIRASTLLIWGEKDDSTPLYFGQVMSREIPDAGLVVLEGAGHFAYLEQLERFCRIVRTFWEGNP
ncbi:MAG: alpha/beta hydrolase [Eubacteriales bacterium]|nr:alpha/beta hydrolase [Eubacteriales bacterium]